MVNSKRMSKSKVAMIALAILLVLSLILTATGAWFTAKAETETQDAASYTWTIGDFINLVANSDDAHKFVAHAYTKYDENADGDLLDDDDVEEVENGGYLHPGDTIEFVDGQTITITASDATHNFYYVILVDGEIVVGSEGANNAKLYTAGDSTTLYTFTVNHNLSGTGSSLVGSPVSSVYTVNASNTVKTDAGKTITLSAGEKSVEIRAIQYNNQTAASAYTWLMGSNGEALVADVND